MGTYRTMIRCRQYWFHDSCRWPPLTTAVYVIMSAAMEASSRLDAVDDCIDALRRQHPVPEPCALMMNGPECGLLCPDVTCGFTTTMIDGDCPLHAHRSWVP